MKYDPQSGDIFVAKDMLDGIDTCTCLDLKRTERMTTAMIGYMLGDTSCLQPLLQRVWVTTKKQV